MPSLKNKPAGVMPEGFDAANVSDAKTLKKMLKDHKKQQKAEPKKKVFSRILGYIFKYYKARFVIVIISIIAGSIGTAMIPVILMLLTNTYIEPVNGGVPTLGGGDTGVLPLWTFLVICASCYIVAVGFSTTYNVLMARIGQGVLYYIRRDMFVKMQSLPISYFDRHLSGDIMSVYTNDVDALRQFICQTLPQLIISAVTLTALLIIMLVYSLWLLLIVLAIVGVMIFVVTKIGSASSRYFILQQSALGKVDGYIEESMHGQKVIKVFCHEEEAKKDFDDKNEMLCSHATKANTYANVLMPVLQNIGNILYVIIAIVGSLIIVLHGFNIGLGNAIPGFDMGLIAVVVGFLSIAKSFTQQIASISQQINFVAMARAGGNRIFAIMDEPSEEDNGYVELVWAKRTADGGVEPSDTYTGLWAWKHPHKAEGTVTYVELKGEIEMHNVDFAYVPGKTVLHDVTLYAKPGQKIAFVGSTGAGKTTITNLINRFYDIEDGKIRYDGININKIKKPDLRRSLGMVLQDTNLFTGTIKDNIRYGKLDATDEEVIEAAKLANAHDFIMRLPDGYDTMLESDGVNLSQGQRQLLSIARTACENAPVLVLDEATSSIDTRTEQIVQSGMDKLMTGRTVFVIAHRLSTVRNSNVIMVLDHGRIIERGTHEQLLEQKGTYYKLYTGAFELE